MSYRSSRPISKAPLTQNDVDLARRALEARRRRAGSADWLSADEACDIPFEGERDAVLAAARAALADRPIDVNVVAGGLPPQAAPRRRHGFHPDRAGMPRRAGRRDRRRRAKSPPSPSAPCAARSRSSRRCASASPCSKGLATGIVAAKCLAERITIMPGAAILVATMRASGAYTALVSGGFTVFAEPIAARHRLRRAPRQRPPPRGRGASPASSPSRSSGARPRKRRCWS